MTLGRLPGDFEAEPQEDVPWVQQPWAVASPKSVGAPGAAYFSAVCYFFGREVHEATQRPIGLISANWGATDIATWSSPEALARCPNITAGSASIAPDFATKDVCPENERSGMPCKVDGDCCSGSCQYYARPPFWPAGGYCTGLNPSNTPSALWNTMIHPLLRMSIYGVIWYQGEADAINKATNYNCTFPSMIDDWRSRWHAASSTDAKFPFGFVQLSSWGTDTSGQIESPEWHNVAIVRWAQTANYGYVPNPRLERVFMAVAIDLGAFNGHGCADTFPNLCIHPQWKQEVARRLALGARAVAYGDQECFQGPAVTRVWSSSPGNTTVEFAACSGAIELRRSKDFDVQLANGTWVLAEASVRDTTSVTLTHPHDGFAATNVRYMWSRAPCEHPHEPIPRPGSCSVYDPAGGGLPAPPFWHACEAPALEVALAV